MRLVSGPVRGIKEKYEIIKAAVEQMETQKGSVDSFVVADVIFIAQFLERLTTNSLSRRRCVISTYVESSTRMAEEDPGPARLRKINLVPPVSL